MLVNECYCLSLIHHKPQNTEDEKTDIYTAGQALNDGTTTLKLVLYIKNLADLINSC